jgi:DNA-binding response OmpR family regulator
MEQSNKTIFVCDDDPDSCELIKFVFGLQGYKVISCNILDECLSQAREKIFQAIILDNRFGGSSSLEVSRQIRSFDSTVPIIFFSGETRQSEIDKALQTGANAYLIKPTDFEKLTATVISLIDEK